MVWLASCVLLQLLASAAGAEPHAVGDRLEPFTLQDQHGTEHRIDASVAVILFSREMKGGDVLKQALEGATAALLDERRAVYVADISGMPGLVARLFAVPSMRRRPYPMLLDRDGSKTARLPSVDEQASLIFIRNLEVTRVLHLGSAEDVRRELGLPEAP
jgi:hypothetical protein